MKDLVVRIERCGYLCSFEDCTNDSSSLQFLKHSPVLCDHDVVEPVINFGVFVRCFGVCDGDLPGRGDLYMRSYLFNRELLQGIFPYFRAPFVRKLRSFYRLFDKYDENNIYINNNNDNFVVDNKLSGKIRDMVHYKTHDEDKTLFHSTDEEYFQRYTSNPNVLVEFNQILSDLSGNRVYRCELTDLALEKDYGFTSHD